MKQSEKVIRAIQDVGLYAGVDAGDPMDHDYLLDIILSLANEVRVLQVLAGVIDPEMCRMANDDPSGGITE